VPAVVFADISSHQEKPPAGVVIGAYAAAGHDRILVKATEGRGYVNPFFARWWVAAGRAGLARGAYHFARPSRTGRSLAAGPIPDHQMGDGYRAHLADPSEAPPAPAAQAGVRSAGSSAAAEADHFVAVLRAAGGLGPRDWVCLDTEDPDCRTGLAAKHNAAFCVRMMQHGFAVGDVYSYGPYLREIGLTAAMLPPGWRRLHIAHYGRVADAVVPLPPGWGRELVVARQYTESARTAGIPGGSDANRVVREWLGRGAGEVDDADVRRVAAAVKGVLDERDARIRGEAFWANEAAGETPIRQENVPRVWAATYRKAGKVEGMLAEVLQVLAGAGPPGHDAVIAAVAAYTDLGLLAEVERAVEARRAALPATAPGGP
jgi:hypothetical protein